MFFRKFFGDSTTIEEAGVASAHSKYAQKPKFLQDRSNLFSQKICPRIPFHILKLLFFIWAFFKLSE